MEAEIEVEVDGNEVTIEVDPALSEALERLAEAVTEVREAWDALPEEARQAIGKTLGELVEEREEDLPDDEADDGG